MLGSNRLPFSLARAGRGVGVLAYEAGRGPTGEAPAGLARLRRPAVGVAGLPGARMGFDPSPGYVR
jgi:hypothetical protein